MIVLFTLDPSSSVASRVATLLESASVSLIYKPEAEENVALLNAKNPVPGSEERAEELKR